MICEEEEVIISELPQFHLEDEPFSAIEFGTHALTWVTYERLLPYKSRCTQPADTLAI
jgi:hypothetical protein